MRSSHPNQSIAIEPLESRRLLSAGSLDTTFSGDGKTEIFPNAPSQVAHYVASDSLGNTIVVGSDNFAATGTTFISVSRLKFDGSFDTTFGTGGRETFLLLNGKGESDSPGGVVVLPNREILVAGTAFRNGTDATRIAVVKLNVDGSLDTSFGSNGAAVAYRYDNLISVNAMAIQNDGKIVLAGQQDTASLNPLKLDTRDFLVLRLNSNGTVDSSFGGGGKQVVDFNGDDSAAALAVDYYGTAQTNPDYGHIVVVGSCDGISDANLENVAMMRLNPDGSLDSSFSSDGKLVLPFATGDYESLGNGVVIEPSGRIVIAGQAQRDKTGKSSDMALMALRASGTIDPDFGTSGKARIDFGGTSDAAEAIVIGHTSNLLVTGYSQGQFAIASLSPDGQLTAGFSHGGKYTVAFPDTPSLGASIALAPNNRVVAAGGTGLQVVRFLDSLPTINARAVSTTASENGPNAGEFLITSDRTDHAIGVFFRIGGTATSPLSGLPHKFFDYTGVSAPPPPVKQGVVPRLTPALFGANIGYVVIPAGATSALVVITPIDDAFVEKDETATFTIADNSAYVVGPAASQTITIIDNDGVVTEPTDDAFVRDGAAASTNFGSATDLQTKKDGSNRGYNRITYLKFNISSLTSNIGTVTLRLFGKLSNTSQKNVLDTLYAVSDTTWSESTINYNNRPGYRLVGLHGSGPLAVTTIIDNTSRLYEWDITSYVKATKLDGKTVVSFALANPLASGPIADFVSKEAPSEHPQLVETFA